MTITNPLTLIAIFAGLAETTAVTVLPFLDVDVQATFVWFVMLFPALLVILFFAVLWRKPANLYAPGDYRADSAFLSIQGTKWPGEALVAADVMDERGGGASAQPSPECDPGFDPTPSSAPSPTLSPTPNPDPTPNPTPSPTSSPYLSPRPAAENVSTDVDAEAGSANGVYALQSPAPTPKIAQATLDYGESIMAERLALQRYRALRSGDLISPATVTVNGVPYQLDGVLVRGREVNILEVMYKRERDIRSRVKRQLEKFKNLKSGMESENDRQSVTFTIIVVTREEEDSFSVESMVAKYAKMFDLNVAVEVYSLRSLMNDLNKMGDQSN